MESVTERLRRAIRESGKTYYQLGLESGVNQAVIARFDHGDRDIRAVTLDKLCKYFGLFLTSKEDHNEECNGA